MTETQAMRDARRTLKALNITGRSKPKSRKLGMIHDETIAELDEYYAENQSLAPQLENLENQRAG